LSIELTLGGGLLEHERRTPLGKLPEKVNKARIDLAGVACKIALGGVYDLQNFIRVLNTLLCPLHPHTFLKPRAYIDALHLRKKIKRDPSKKLTTRC